IRACAEMPIPPRLLIVGDGPDRARLERVAAQHYPQAEFIGEKHGEALAPFFHMADLFVLPGTGGLAIQEAMSYALPILVAHGDGSQDDLVRPENGWQIPPDDYPALVQTLRLALSDGVLLRQKGEASYRIVRDEVNLERMVAAFIEAIHWVLKNRQ
ncbi:MAG: glycosyltransferase family 4 protein, partial [Anaerolineales bacterium]